MDEKQIAALREDFEAWARDEYGGAIATETSDSAKIIDALWSIIDDIDTYDDAAKGDDALYRKLVRARQKDRWKTGITTDGYGLKMPQAAQQQAEPVAAEREREALAAFSMLYSACTTAMFAMGKDGANASVMHPMREAWEQCREAEQTAQKAMAKHRLFAAQSGQRAGVAEVVLDYLKAHAVPSYQVKVTTNPESASLCQQQIVTVDCGSWGNLIEHIQRAAAPTQQQERRE